MPPQPSSASVTQIQPRPPALDVELGVTLDLPFGGFSDELPNPAESGSQDLLERLDAMQRNDGHQRALYRLLTLPFRRAKFSVVPADGGDDEAALIEAMLSRPPHEGGMTTSFDYVRACASKAFVNGFSAFEEVYQEATIPGYGDAIVLRKLAPREARTVRFKADDNGGFDGLVQRASKRRVGLDKIDIPRNKCFFFTVDKEDHPFYGRSLFEPALYHWDRKHKLYYISHISAQLGAISARLGYLDRDDLTPAEKNNLRTALASLGFNSAMLVPKGVRVEPFDPAAGGVAEHLLELIHHHDVMSSQSVLGQFIDLAQGSSATGSFALSKDSTDTFVMCEETLLAAFFEHLTWYVVPKFIDWNFGSRRYPTIVAEPLADDMREAMVTIFEALATATTANTTPEFMHELEKKVADRLGLEVDYDAIEEERAQQEEADTAAGADILEAVKSALAAPPAPAEPPPGGGEDFALAAAEAERALIELAEVKRDRLGQFSRVNEVGAGAGFRSKGQEQHKALVEDIQTRLERAGFDLKQFGVDGLFGTVTAEAVRAFQEQNGLPPTGRVDLGTYSLLLEEAPDGAKPEAAGGEPGAEDEAKAKSDLSAAQAELSAIRKRAGGRGSPPELAAIRKVDKAKAAVKKAGGRRKAAAAKKAAPLSRADKIAALRKVKAKSGGSSAQEE